MPKDYRRQKAAEKAEKERAEQETAAKIKAITESVVRARASAEAAEKAKQAEETSKQSSKQDNQDDIDSKDTSSEQINEPIITNDTTNIAQTAMTMPQTVAAPEATLQPAAATNSTNQEEIDEGSGAVLIGSMELQGNVEIPASSSSSAGIFGGWKVW